MKYTELESIIKELKVQSNDLSKQLRQLNGKISELTQQKISRESELFVEFIGLNFTVEFKGYLRLTGVQINIKNTPLSPHSKLKNSNIWGPTFNKGDVIKVVKLNKKSVIVECIKKVVVVRNEDNSTSILEINPESQFRIDINDFKNTILTHDSNHKNFTTWIKRKESLDDLLND